MADHESTMKWKVDVTQLTKAMQEAKRSINQANAEFKTATAGLDRWSKSTTGLEAKLKQLNKTLPQQKTILQQLEKQYELTAKNLGENSSAAIDLKTKIEEQRATIVKTETNIAKYNDQLGEMKARQAESETAYGKLTSTIADQEEQLESLKKAYKNAVLQYGENSQEARSLANDIEGLSSELADNKRKMNDVEGAADDLDKSLDDAGNSANDAAKGGFTVLKGAMANLVADGISKAIDGLKQLAGKVVEVGKQSIASYASYEQLIGGVETLFGAGGKTLEEYAKTAKASVADLQASGINWGKYASNSWMTAGGGVSGLFDEIKYNLETLKTPAAELEDYLVSEYNLSVDDAKKAISSLKMSVEDKGIEKSYKRLIDAQNKVVENANKAYKTAGMSANDYMETVTSFSASLIQGLNGDTAKAAKIADMAIIDMSDNANKMGSDMQSLQNAYQGFAKGNFTMLDNLKLGYGGTKEEMLRLVKDAGVVNDSIKSIDDVSFDKIIEAIHIVQTDIGITGTTAKEAATTIEGSKNSMLAAWSNLLTEFAKSDGDVKSAFDTFAESAITYASNLLPRVKELARNLIDFARDELEKSAPELLSFLDTIGNGIETTFNIFKTLFDFISTHKDVIIAALAGIGAAIVAWNIVQMASSVIAFAKALQAVGLQAAITAAKQWLLNSALLANPIGLVIAAIAGLVTAFIVLWQRSDAFRNFWVNLWEKIKEAASSAKDKISGWIDTLKNKFDEISSKAVEIKDKIVDAWNNLKNKTGEMKDKVVSYFEALRSGIAEKINNAKDKVSDAVDKIKEFLSFDGLKKKVSDLFESIKDKITSPIEKAKELVTSAVDKIKGIFPIKMGKIFSGIKLPHFKISGGEIPWGIGGKGKKPSVDIEWYAKGGVFDKGARIAGIGENGAEAVVPLERNTKWIARVAKELVAQIGAASNGMNQTAVQGIASNKEVVQNFNFNQYNNSPKALSRLEIYRQTNSLLFAAKARFQNV